MFRHDERGLLLCFHGGYTLANLLLLHTELLHVSHYVP
jgi:hypothetical protein